LESSISREKCDIGSNNQTDKRLNRGGKAEDCEGKTEKGKHREGRKEGRRRKRKNEKGREGRGRAGRERPDGGGAGKDRKFRTLSKSKQSHQERPSISSLSVQTSTTLSQFSVSDFHLHSQPGDKSVQNLWAVWV